MKKTARAIVSSALSVLLTVSGVPTAALAEVQTEVQGVAEYAAAEATADEGVSGDDAPTPALLTTTENAFDYVTTDVAADPYSTVTNDGETATTNVGTLVTLIEDAAANLTATVTLPRNTYTVAELRDAMGLAVSDPENYWLDPAFSISYYDSDGTSGCTDADEAAAITLTYLASDADVLATMKTSMEAKVSEALSWVDVDEMTQFQVVQALHDYLVRNCAYDTSVSSTGNGHDAAFTAYGALVDGKPVCQGYALAYKLLLGRLGISCVFVTSTSMNHGWNMVQMDDGSWYHVDVTYDDPVYQSTSGEKYDGGFDHIVSHTYFLIGDSTMTSLGHHDWSAAYSAASDYAVPSDGYGTYTGPVTTSAASEKSTTTTTYAHSESKTSGSVTFTVQWNDPVAGEDTTFHVTQTGGSDVAEARMDVPTYYDSDGSGAESVCDPSRNSWGTYYTLGDEGHDFTFSFTASGKYYMLFYYMDTTNKVYYLRSNFFITIDDAGHPAVSTIVANAVAQAQAETDGSDYQMALWLHDWELEQLDYDYSLNYCSAESGLTRGKGTCESFERIYQKLLTKAGLQNARMEGNGHTWNAVCIDGKWCQVDVNWDDDPSGTSTSAYGFDATHLYFGLTDELMAKAHSDHATTYQADGYAYRSTDLSNNYFVRSGQAATWAAAYTDRIQAQLEAGKTTFSITSDNASNPPSITGIQNAIVASQIAEQWTTSDGGAVLLSVEPVSTTYSSYSWTAEYSFTADFYYSEDVSTYKPSSDQSTWTAPTKDNMVFAGWYTDTSCETAYTAETGTAYARFVAPSDLITFRGCSLRNDYSSADKTSIRFAFEFSVPAGAERTSMSWDWSNAKNGKSGTVTAKSFWLLGDGSSALANVVFVNLPRSGTSFDFDTTLTATGKVTYTTADGTTVTATGGAVSRTVAEVAGSIASGATTDSDEKSYAEEVSGSCGTTPTTDSHTSVFTRASVAAYKSSDDQSSWTAPAKSGYAFAGWYTAASTDTVYTGTTGYAYARFIPVTELVAFRGCSLRNDYSSSDKTSIRFAYEFGVPAGATCTGVSWDWSNAKTSKSGTVSSKSHWLLGDGSSMLANVVFVNLTRSGTSFDFDTTLTTTGKVTYVTADGTTVTATGETVSRTVTQVAGCIASGAAASTDEKSYASDILGA